MKLGLISTMAASPWGGSEELWVALGKKAIREGDEVFASVYDWGQLPPKIAELREEGAKLTARSRISYPALRGKVRGKWNQLVVAKRQLHRFASQSRPDLLVISTGAFCDLEIPALRKFLTETDVPFCLIIHSNLETQVVPASIIAEVRAVCKKAKRVFFVSERLRRQAERQIAYGFPNSLLVQNPVNMKEKGILPYPDGPVRMACVGSLQVAVKGQAMLLQLLSAPVWKERNWTLNIFGTGPDEQLLRELIGYYGLENRVFLKGYTNDVRAEIWSQNHLLLMPSYIEGMPISLFEAMLSGRTAVVTDVGGCREVTDDSLNAFMAESASPFSYGNALERAWSKKEEWKQMGEAAFEKASAICHPDPAGKLLDLLRAII